MKNGLKYILPFLCIVVLLCGKGAVSSTYTHGIAHLVEQAFLPETPHSSAIDCDHIPSPASSSFIHVRTVHKHVRRTDNGPRRYYASDREGWDMAHRHTIHVHINLKLCSPLFFESAHCLLRLGRLIL